MLHLQFELDPETLWVGGGKQKSWKPENLKKRLEWRDRHET